MSEKPERPPARRSGGRPARPRPAEGGAPLPGFESAETASNLVPAPSKTAELQIPEGPPAPVYIVVHAALPSQPPDKSAGRIAVLTAIAGICGSIALVAVPLIGAFTDDKPSPPPVVVIQQSDGTVQGSG